MKITKEKLMSFLKQPAVVAVVAGVFGGGAIEALVPEPSGEDIETIEKRLDEHEEMLKRLKVIVNGD